MARVQLQEIAFTRSGDKGDISNVGVIPFDPEDYELLWANVTVDRVKEHFRGIVLGDVVRYELPGIRALNFVMTKALGGGVSRSLNLDTHGKSWGNLMLTLELDVDRRLGTA